MTMKTATKLSPSIIKVTINRCCSKRLKSTASTASASRNRNTIYTNRPNNTSLILTKQQRHKKSTMIVDGRPVIETKTKTRKSTIEQLSSDQIRSIFLSAAIPMVGFGFMDNFVMITAGQAIDNTLGIRFGLATMTAAAMGQVISDVSGVMFGDTLGRLFNISSAQLTTSQKKLKLVSRTRLLGAVIGVTVGCCLGAVALYLVPDRDADDTGSSSTGATMNEEKNNVNTKQQQQQQIKTLQKVLNDFMTNEDEIWRNHSAKSTLFVDESIGRYIASLDNTAGNNRRNLWRLVFGNSQIIDEGSEATIDVLLLSESSSEKEEGREHNKKEIAAIRQSVKESRAVIFTNTIYVPVDGTVDNKSRTLGVLKIELGNGSFYSGSEIKDAKRVARNLGFFMNHMMDVDDNV